MKVRFLTWRAFEFQLYSVNVCISKILFDPCNNYGHLCRKQSEIQLQRCIYRCISITSSICESWNMVLVNCWDNFQIGVSWKCFWGLCIRERAELKARNRSLLQTRRIPLTTHKEKERATTLVSIEYKWKNFRRMIFPQILGNIHSQYQELWLFVVYSTKQ